MTGCKCGKCQLKDSPKCENAGLKNEVYYLKQLLKTAEQKKGTQK